MDVGRLSRRFEIQKPTRTQNDFGEVVITWTKVASRWGSLRPITGTDRLNGSQVSSEVSHNVTLRQDSTLTIQPDWRLTSGTRTFDVVQVFDPEDSRSQWTLEVSEVVAV